MVWHFLLDCYGGVVFLVGEFCKVPFGAPTIMLERGTEGGRGKEGGESRGECGGGREGGKAGMRFS